MGKINRLRKPKQKRSLTVLKLGGSVVTKKANAFTLSDHLPRLAKEIKGSGVRNLIIVHGGGSFGHYPAHKHEINKGFKHESQIFGFAETQKAMEVLNNHVVEALQAEGIPAFPIQPSAITIMENGKIKILYSGIVKRALHIGLVPVLYGVPALDLKMGFCILSGDEIVNNLANNLKATRVLLASDVTGVMTADPKTAKTKPKLIKTVTEKNYKRLRLSLPGVTDVTGGMWKKVNELLNLAKFGIQSEIIDATLPGNLKRALRGEKIGTTIK
ncbi:MAG: isopentenyl phosphate kinase [archaeon]